MPMVKLMVDTNIVVDVIAHRGSQYEEAKKLMTIGRVGDMQLWLTSTQITDLIYILSGGGKTNQISIVLRELRKLRSFVHIYAISEKDIDLMLATDWDDPEDALLNIAATRIGADAIITRNKQDFEKTTLKAWDCKEFFEWIEGNLGLVYEEVIF